MRLTRDGVLVGLLVVLALVVGSAITQLLPAASDVYRRPYEHHGRLGQAVVLRTGTVTVTGLRSAAQVSANGNVAQSSGLWLVVDLTWTASTEPSPLALDGVRLATPDGRRFGGLPAIAVTCGAGQPGIATSCRPPLEVTRDALEGATLLVPAMGSVTDADDLAVVDLGLDAAAAAALVEAARAPGADPVTIGPPTERGR